MSEEWRDVPGFEGYYQASTEGRVRSVGRMIQHGDHTRRQPAKVLNPWLNKGYPTVGLRRDGRTVTRQVHRLVLAAFIGPCPDGMEGCHKDGDPTNNQLDNLRWDTSSANKHDIVAHGNHHWANKDTCPRGHRLEGANLVASSLALGSRLCRACNQARAYAKRHGVSFESVADEKYTALMGAKA